MVSRQRQRTCVDPAIQWALGKRLTLHWSGFFLAVVSLGVALHGFDSIATVGAARAIREGVSSQLANILVMFVLLPVFLRDSMHLSNRIAGPMHRIRSGLATLGSGASLPPLTLRAGDFWQETALRFNEVRERIELLEMRNAQMEVENRRLMEAIEALEMARDVREVVGGSAETEVALDDDRSNRKHGTSIASIN